jgi:hypothetical protein
VSNGEWSRAVAHEMECYLDLHRRMKSKAAVKSYDQVVWSAMRTAYGAHVRNLLEFFHCGASQDRDVCWKDLAREDSPFGPLKDGAAIEGLWSRASKQVSHLSKHRGGQDGEWADAEEWGNDLSHRDAIVPKIQRAVDTFGDQIEGIPELLRDFLTWEKGLSG